MTAREVAERVSAAANIESPDKAALADLTGSILASLRVTPERVYNGPMRAHRPGGALSRLSEVQS
jgi:hypothetical protein